MAQVTILAAHLTPLTSQHGLQAPRQVQSSLLWTYATQIMSALHHIHGQGLALGKAALHPSKVGPR